MTSLVVAAAMVVLIYLGNASLFRRLRLDTNSKLLRIGGRHFPISWASGAIVDYRQDRHRWLDRGISFTGPVVDPKYLTDPGPNADRFEEFTIAAPEWPAPIVVSNTDGQSLFERLQGQRLTALWVTTVERKYLGFHGPSSRVDHPDVAAALASLIKPGLWANLPAMVLGYVLGASLEAVPLGLLCAVAVLPVYGALFRAVAGWRRKVFREREVEPFLREIARQSAGASS